MLKFTFKQLVRDIIITSLNFMPSYKFAQKHRLWEGIMNYRWITKLLVVFAVLSGLQLFSMSLGWMGDDTGTNINFSSLGGAVTELASHFDDLFLIGGLKYIVLILAEIVIFHFVRRTLELVTGEYVDSSFKTFVKAQKRMIRVAIYSFVMESFYSVIFKALAGAVGLDFIQPTGVFLIQCFFLGFAIVDNYNEIFHMTVKQSFKYTKIYAGVALVIGIPVYLIMLFPVIGTIIGPVIGAIVATLTMNELLMKDGKMDEILAVT